MGGVLQRTTRSFGEHDGGGQRRRSTVDGGTTQGTVEGPLTLEATVGLTDGHGGAAPLTVPGRPALCPNIDRCHTQEPLTAPVLLRRASDEREHMRLRWSHPRQREMECSTTSRRRNAFLMPARTRSTWSGTEWTLARSGARVGGLGGGGVGVLPATVLHPCKTTSLSQNIYHDWTVAMAWGGAESLKGWYVDDDDKVARINKRAQAFRRRVRRFAKRSGLRKRARRVELCRGSLLCGSGDVG